MSLRAASASRGDGRLPAGSFCELGLLRWGFENQIAPEFDLRLLRPDKLQEQPQRRRVGGRSHRGFMMSEVAGGGQSRNARYRSADARNLSMNMRHPKLEFSEAPPWAG